MSISISAVLWFDMDVSGFTVLGIDPQNRLDESAIALLLFLAISHLVNWVGDAISNGKFSTFAQKKPLEHMGDIQKERSYISEIRENLSRCKEALEKPLADAPQAKPSENMQIVRQSLENVSERFEKLEKSGWWFSNYARFYVIGWNLVVPLIMAAIAIRLLYHA